MFVTTPPNEHTSEGGRDDRGVPYHAESTLSSAQVLKYGYVRFPRPTVCNAQDLRKIGKTRWEIEACLAVFIFNDKIYASW